MVAMAPLYEEQLSTPFGSGFLVSEEPRHRLIHYYSTRFYLPIPWVHYKVRQFNRGEEKPPLHFVETVYFSRYPLTESRAVTYPFLPNFYGPVPCHGYGYHADILTDKYTHIGMFWQGTFTRDGRISRCPAWRELAHLANCNVRQRKEILAYWETLSMEEVMSLPFPASETL